MRAPCRAVNHNLGVMSMPPFPMAGVFVRVEVCFERSPRRTASLGEKLIPDVFIMNLELIRLRSQVVKAVRTFFDGEGFLEVQTPRLVGLPGQEPYLEPFWTEVIEANGAKHAAALITSPEYAMKRLLAAGMDKIYDLGPCFRNHEPWDGSHDPEFLMIEWYRREAGLEALLHDTEAMIRSVAQAVGKEREQRWQSALATPFRVLTVREAVLRYADVDINPLLEDREGMAQVVAAHGQSVHEADTWDDLFFKLFLSEVEPKLGWTDDRSGWQPTFLTHYPASMAALARKAKDDPRYALRTELYIGDLELANGFAELSDEAEQRKRFEEERQLRASLGKPTWGLDERFLTALPGMGDAAGIAFGVERLVMLLAGAGSITEILPYSARERFDVKG